MRTTIGILGFLAVGAGAVSVGAAVALQGSDTIKDVTIELLTNNTLDCGGVTNSVPGDLTYVGSGSGNGQAQIVASATSGQFVAPMSRAMNTGVCATAANAARAVKAEGIVFSLDGISLVSGNSAFASCSGTQTCNTDPAPGLGLRFSGNINGTPVADWKDALRLLYFGVRSPNLTLAARDCKSADRVALVSSWNTFFQTCTTTSCPAGIQHAYRRNDESGTTDTFVTALGVTAISLPNNTAAFCNTGTNGGSATQVILPDAQAFINAVQIPPGSNINTAGNRGQYWTDQQDLDPIRRACAFVSVAGAQDDVCEADRHTGTGLVGLGVVLPVWEAPVQSTTTAPLQLVTAFPTVTCDPGVFICKAAAATSTAGKFELCPNGTDPNSPPAKGYALNSPICGAGNCAVPVHKLADGTLDAQCFNPRTNIEGGLTPPYDGRTHNLTAWALNPTSLAVQNAKVLRNGTNVNMVGAYYKIHGSHPFATGGEMCTNGGSATDQIGCLVRAEPCSIGYAGNSAVQGNTFAINVNNVAPSNTCVQNLVNLPVGDPATYPLSRKLYLNSLDGFENLAASSATQFKMASCFANGTASTIANGAPPPVGHGGFVPLPGNPFCEDFDETQTGCSVTAGQTNNDACVGNPSPIPAH